MGTGFARKKKEQKHYQEQLMKMQQTISEKMEHLEAEGSAGNGLVTITLLGTGELKKIRLQKECVDPEDIEGLEALIKAAYNSAFKQLQEIAEIAPKMPF
jgi:DNA-binding YbaB/EbfC family protein